MQHPNVPKGILCVLFSVLVWSGWMVVSRFSVLGTLTPYDITAIRFAVAGVILFPGVLKRGWSVGPWGIKSSFIISLLMGAAYTNLAVAGMRFAPTSHASTIINGVLLATVTLVGIFVLRESTTPIRLIGIACSFVGIVCMLVAKDPGDTSRAWIGHILFVLSGAMWAGYTLLIRVWKVDAIHGASIVAVFSLLTYLPLYLIFAHSQISLNNWHEVVFQGIYQGLITGTLALISYNTGIAILGAARAASFIPLVPVLSTLLAIPVLNECPTPLEWAGVAMVSIGVSLGSGAIARRKKPAPVSL